MSMDARVTKLEDALGPDEEITIRVVHVPVEVEAEDLDAYLAAHPEAVTKTIVHRGPAQSWPPP
jgi:hypothetical protein